MRHSKQRFHDEYLGRWIRDNPGRPFMISVNGEMFGYKRTSIGNGSEIKLTGIDATTLSDKVEFWFDEAAKILEYHEEKKP